MHVDLRHLHKRHCLCDLYRYSLAALLEIIADVHLSGWLLLEPDGPERLHR